MSKIKIAYVLTFALLLFLNNSVMAGGEDKVLCGEKVKGEFFNPGSTAFHHVADANVYSIGPISIPLPCITYTKEKGIQFFSSGRFKANASRHGSGDYAVNGFALEEGTVKNIKTAGFPSGDVKINGGILHKKEKIDGKYVKSSYLCHDGKQYKLEKKFTADFGLFGGDKNSTFYDFSITKNVLTMLLMFGFLAWIFIGIANKYKRNRGQAPSGVQALIEPVFLFIQEDVAKPFLGNKWEKYQPFLMALFFFILGLNLFGQIPFLGGSNVTGNLAVTMVLAIFAFLVTNFSGNKHYWEHIFKMPGVPAWVLTILTPVEFLGVFIKPITLMLRLFANITAGHMVMVIFVGLIFVFGQGNTAPSLATVIPSTLLTVFMMAIELLVAFIQAFVFTILTASYIGAAIEDGHHGEAAHH